MLKDVFKVLDQLHRLFFDVLPLGFEVKHPLDVVGFLVETLN